jgi:hypothetical protein
MSTSTIRRALIHWAIGKILSEPVPEDDPPTAVEDLNSLMVRALDLASTVGAADPNAAAPATVNLGYDVGQGRWMAYALLADGSRRGQGRKHPGPLILFPLPLSRTLSVPWYSTSDSAPALPPQ